MGRTKINDLFNLFVEKYGEGYTTAFQQARLNLIQSMATYYIAYYILQIQWKYYDRRRGPHNPHRCAKLDFDSGLRAQTRIADFGFLFDIDEYLYPKSRSLLPIFRRF